MGQGRHTLRSINDPVYTRKTAAMISTVHNTHTDFMLTYWCSQSVFTVKFEGTVYNTGGNCMSC